MKSFVFNRNLSHLAVLQRVELIDKRLKKVRKLFGRYIFSKIISKYFINIREVSKNYFKIMEDEFHSIEKYIYNRKNFLSIGAGIGGLELLILSNLPNSHLTFIEKNYISKKIKYGWDETNNEGYNDLCQLEKFILSNKIASDRFRIFDFNKNNFPINKFEVLISLYSLDYHYDFNIYYDYIKKVMNNESILIFDTIRPDYFKNIFKFVEVIKEDINTVHKSKRIICSKFIK